MNKQKSIEDIPVPYGVDERQATIARDFVVSRLQDGYTVEGFCRKHSLSTKSFYKYKENEAFAKYVDQLNEVLIPKDVLSAVDKFRLKVMAFVEKDNMSKDEMSQFYNMFKPVIDASNRMEAERLGLTVNTGSTSATTTQSVEERKNALVARLTAKPTKEKDVD
jgi:hypothetical protein